MKLMVRNRINAFRRALELGAHERSSECRHMSRWKTGLDGFPGGCCDLASDCLAKYLIKCDPLLQPFILIMNGTDLAGSRVSGHAIVLLNGYYIDLTYDQFSKDGVCIPWEPMETGGAVGKLIRDILTSSEPGDGAIYTRKCTLDAAAEDCDELFEWLCDTADSISDDIEPDFQDNGEQHSAVSLEILPEFANYTPL